MSRVAPFPSMASIGDRLGPAIARHFLTTFRSLVHGDGVVNEAGYFRLLTGEPHPFGNLAIVVDPGDLENTKNAIAPLCAGGAPAAVAFPGTPVAPDVEAHLQAQGFHLHELMPAMAVDVDDVPSIPLPPGYELVRVGDGQDGEDWTACLATGYEIPPGVAKVFSPESIDADMAPDAAVQFFAIRRGDEIVSTSLLYLDDGLAGVYCVATLPHERGKGLGAVATAEPLRMVRELGYGVGVLQSSAMGHSVYRRIGFRDYGAVPLYVRMPSD